jgi:tetratricopeptide (TPR) repeat protein
MVAKPETDTILQAVRRILSDRFRYDQHGSPDAWPGLRDLLPSAIAWCNLARADTESGVETSVKARDMQLAGLRKKEQQKKLELENAEAGTARAEISKELEGITSKVRVLSNEKKEEAAAVDVGLLITAGNVLQRVNGDAKSACAVFTEARSWAEKVLPRDHPEIATVMSDMALSLQSLGRHMEALKLQEQTLAFRKEILPKDHPDISMSMNNLARTLSSMGRHTEALKLQEDMLAFQKRVLPKDHPSITNSMHNLATSLSSLERHEDSLNLQEETLSQLKRILPNDHPDIATSMGNLASSLSSLGRNEEALELQEETLAFRKRVLPRDHPDIATSMSDLALSLLHFRRHRPAEALYKNAMLIGLRAGFDRNHPLIKDAKIGIQMAKQKGSIPNAIELPKPRTPCSCCSGKKYRDCCF